MSQILRCWLLVACGLLVGVRAGAAPAPSGKHAAAAAPGPTITIGVTSSTKVQVSSAATGAVVCASSKQLATACAQDATAAGCTDAQTRPTYTPGGAAQTVDIAGGERIPLWLQSVLAGEDLWCATAAPADPVQAQVQVNPPAGDIAIDGGLDPDSGTPNMLVWGSWQTRAFVALWQSVGTKVTAQKCHITPAGGVVRDCTTTLAPSTAALGTQRVSLSYSGDPISSGIVTFEIGSYHFKADVHACALAPTATLATSLLAGANLQVLEISAPGNCAARLSANRASLKKDTTQLTLTALTPLAGDRLRLTLTGIPSDVSAGTWSVQNERGEHIGDITLGVEANPISVRGTDGTPQLGIHYGIVHSPTELDQWHDGKSTNGLAVVTAAKTDSEQYIQNTASLVVAPQLLALARSLNSEHWNPPGASDLTTDIKCKSLATTCDDLDAKYDPDSGCKKDPSPSEDRQIDACHRARRSWRVTAHTWEESVWLQENRWWHQGEAVALEELGGVTFAIFATEPHPFEVAVELVEHDASRLEERVVFRQFVQLASGARYESLPLPLAQALYIECGHHLPGRGMFPSVLPATDRNTDVIENGYTRAVNDDDVLTGNCRLHYSPQLVLRALKLSLSDKGEDILRYYGRQELTVSVRRGEAEQTVAWSLDPVREQEMRLPLPRDAKNAAGIYVVTAGLRGPLPPAVNWRASQTQSLAQASPDLGELEFHANLRPRGPFGWKAAPIRLFMTFPLSFTGVRFPARPSELPASSSSKNAQVTKILAGALVAVEPWNYDTGRNNWPVPTRFVTGMNFYNVSDGKFAPSWLTGLSFTLPVIDLQKGIAEDQLSSDVALGLFWETDVAEQQWYKHGNHFLATFGLNLLSLFGSK